VGELFQQFFKIAFLMGKPQDIPASLTSMRIAVFAAFVTYVLALVGFAGVPTAVLTATVDIGLIGLLLYLALHWTGRLARFNQAFTGFCGASIFINLAALPIYLSFGSGVDLATLPAESRVTFDTANFVLMVWTISLAGHIVRHTFEISMVFSILIAFAYVMLLTFILGVLFSIVGLNESTTEQLSVIQTLECIWWCTA